jgi:putative two-component system response regulator
MRVLIVDDSASNLILLEQLVRRVRDCEILTFTDPVAALAAVRDSAIDLALLDYLMPGLDGLEMIGKLRSVAGHEDIPIVVITATGSILQAALDAGATDFLTKPIDPAEAKSRIRNMLKLRESQNALRDKAAWLAEEVKKATAALAAREEEIILRLSRAAEYRDTDTGQHIMRMAQYCRLIGRALKLDEESCRSLYLSAPMHDLGKIAIGDAILLKPGKLSPEERSVMERHTVHGYEILFDSDCELIRLAAEIARSHHERWDGSGYPSGLRGTEIPLFGRIAAVADVFDALTSERPYKRAWTPEEARAHIAENAGKHFDPLCVKAFLQCWDEVLAIHGGGTTSKAVA